MCVAHLCVHIAPQKCTWPVCHLASLPIGMQCGMCNQAVSGWKARATADASERVVSCDSATSYCSGVDDNDFAGEIDAGAARLYIVFCV